MSNEDEWTKQKAMNIVGLILAGIVLIWAVNFISDMADDLKTVNGAPDELIIEVPISFGEPIAVAASRSGTFDRHMVTILFERGVITIQLRYSQSYRLVYVD